MVASNNDKVTFRCLKKVIYFKLPSPINPAIKKPIFFIQLREDAGCWKLSLSTFKPKTWNIGSLMPLFLFLVEEQAKPFDPHSPLQPLNGQLLPLHAVLRPLCLLPLSPVQHHVHLLEN